MATLIMEKTFLYNKFKMLYKALTSTPVRCIAYVSLVNSSRRSFITFILLFLHSHLLTDVNNKDSNADGGVGDKWQQ